MGKRFFWLMGMALMLAACGGGDGSSTPDGAAGAAGSTTNADPQKPSDGACVESALFPAQPHGDSGSDMFRGIRVDPASGDVYLEDLAQAFKWSTGEASATLLGDLPDGAESDGFWLFDEQLLFPGGYANPSLEQQLPVLLATDLSGADAKVIVRTDAPSDEVNYDVRSVRIVGDHVYWLAWEEPRPASLSDPKPEGTYYLRRAPWRSPGEQEDLYSTHRRFESLVVAGNLAFIEEELEPGSYDYEQTIFDLNAKAALAETAEERLGGIVVGGDDGSLFVAIQHFDTPVELGMFRMDHDGGGKQLLSENPFSGNFTSSGETWIFTDGQTLADPSLVYAYRVGDSPKRLGCVNRPATIHAVAASADTAYVGIFRDDTTSVLTYDF